MPRLAIPDPLLRFTQGNSEVQLASSSVQTLILDLKEHHPGLYQVLFGQHGELNGFVNIYLNRHLLSHRLTENVPLAETDLIEIVVAVSGG